MPKKCPPGVICIENVTILVIFIILAGLLLFINSRFNGVQQNNERIIIKERKTNNTSLFNILPKMPFSYSNIPNDVLMNPYQPPLKDDRIFRRDMSDPRGVPINVPTRTVDSVYRQVGILTRSGGPEMILPLMGKPLYSSRDKWNYYTMSNENNMVKLPITYKNKSCTNEYGCDSLYNGDMVYVEGYNDTFKVTVYDNQVMRYIPYL
jgi:hypothetical protein